MDLNRTVAIGMVFGPEAGLEIVDRLVNEPLLYEYPFLPSVRADLLAKLGRFAEAKREVERAVVLTKNMRERQCFLPRATLYGPADGAS